MKKTIIIIAVAVCVTGLITLDMMGQGCGGCKKAPLVKKASEQVSKSQTKCPVMGGKINKSLYTDVEGVRIYVCCKGCIPTIKKDPKKYIDKLKKAGVTLEKVPATEKK